MLSGIHSGLQFTDEWLLFVCLQLGLNLAVFEKVSSSALVASGAERRSLLFAGLASRAPRKSSSFASHTVAAFQRLVAARVLVAPVFLLLS